MRALAAAGQRAPPRAARSAPPPGPRRPPLAPVRRLTSPPAASADAMDDPFGPADGDDPFGPPGGEGEGTGAALAPAAPAFGEQEDDDGAIRVFSRYKEKDPYR